MRRARTKVLSGLALVVTAAALAAACGSSSDQRVTYRLAPLQAVVSEARADADAMARHADEMVVALGERADEEHWASDVATLRANVRSMRALADWGAAIVGSQALYPPSSRRIDLDRQYGDGQSLQSLAETVIAHAGAMETHVAAMRTADGVDPELLATLDLLDSDAVGMREDGEAAFAAGQSIVEQAREFARSIGRTLD